MLSLLGGMEMSFSIYFTFGKLGMRTKSKLFHCVPNGKAVERKHEKQKARNYF